jgi:hypothetical protein
MNPVSLETKIAVLRNIGFCLWDERYPNEFQERWCEIMVSKHCLPVMGVITFGFFASMYIGREPEYHPGLGYYFIFGNGPSGNLEVFPPVSKMSRTVPFCSPHAICLVDKPPDSFTENIRITEIIENGIVRGEYSEPKDEVFRSYCTTA